MYREKGSIPQEEHDAEQYIRVVSEPNSLPSALYLPANVQGVKFKYLVDTGPRETIISKRVFADLSRTKKIDTKETNVMLYRADQKAVEVSCMATIDLGLFDETTEWEVLVVEIKDDAILGMDFLMAYECCIHPAQRTVTCQGRQLTDNQLRIRKR